MSFLSTKFHEMGLTVGRLKEEYKVREAVFFVVAGKVLPQGAEQDHNDKTDEEEDHHKGVEDGKPVDLKGRRRSIAA